MDTQFCTLLPHSTVAEAAKMFKIASSQRSQKVFGLIVTDEEGRLVGMLSMYDILILLRPKHIHIWGEMQDIDVTGFLDEACRRAKSIRVADIMSPDVVYLTPETHLLMIVDIMINKHFRRLPVVDNGKVVGIVYATAVFYQLIEGLVN